MMLPAQAAMLSGGLKNALIANPDATAAALQQAIRGGSQEALQALVLEHAAIPDDVDGLKSRLRQGHGLPVTGGPRRRLVFEFSREPSSSATGACYRQNGHSL